MNFRIDGSDPLWYKYVLCGIQGIKDIHSTVNYSGLNLVIDGNIPPSSGLSSSSALVCGAAFAVVKAFGIQMSTKDLADACAVSERYIGTQGGGMDQAACLLSSKG